ncbi:hypothetical protein [Vibrio marisflavi]|uniref:Uncharacterized protein n=1 Tax=Vibrio marisflavi CECT 7928 TaxID=634439 RepID=A0ABN8EAG3_9VIBR|nr:hypothetical protein [Vibrio marisflavi]CAH0543046.1 hypothetical protein VMF7928_04375 [Vibrio marisflavi CECT 7928]
MAVMCGVPDDDGISRSLKCTITQEINGATITVVGYMSEECQLSLRSMWESPFAGDSVGNAGQIDKLASVMQTQSDKTSKTQMNSDQVWEGIEPPEVSVTLKFVAYTNARIEVDLPIEYLNQMASPELLNATPVGMSDGGVSVGGRIPDAATFDLGRKFKAKMRISDVSFNVNAPKTQDGHYAYNTVSLTVAPKSMINKSQIPNFFF